MINSLVLFLVGFLIAPQTRATFLELNVSNTSTKLNVHSDVEIIPPQQPLQSTGSTSKLSSVVRIESRAKDFEETQNARWGTGVIVGRYSQGPSHHFRGREGFLVLTANHVLLDSEDEQANRLTLFTDDRRAWRTLAFRRFSISAGEDLALLEVETSPTEQMAIELPKLGFLNPSDFREYSWVPNYTRMNPGLTEQKELSYSNITPLLRASMVTQDAVNSLAPLTESFWYIGGEFVPGMSGGPVFTSGVQTKSNEPRPDLDNLLLGLMGYIFDRQSKFGYAYPITAKSFSNLLSTDSSELGTSLPISNMRINSPGLNLLVTADIVQFAVNKKKAPDTGVADELILRIPLKIDNTAFNEPHPLLVELQQVNEFPMLNKEKLIELLKESSPFFRINPSRTGAPGGGGMEGSPGGGGVEGSPGGGGVEGSPGGGSKENLSLTSFEQVHSVALVVLFSNGMKSTYVVEKVSANGTARRLEFIKDLFSLLKLGQSIELVATSKPIDSYRVADKEGLLDLNGIKSDSKPLSSLGEIVWNSGRLHVRSIKGLHGITLNLSTHFRDTKVGTTRKFDLRLGLHVDTVTGGRAEPLAVQIKIDDKVVPTPKGLDYSYENGILKVTKQNLSILEVHL